MTKIVALPQRLMAETLGTAFLLAAVVGSGIMAQRLAGGNEALALLCNTLPTGAILTVLILAFGPLSGAHFNPAVSVAFALRGEIQWRDAGYYVAAQIVGAIIGVWAALAHGCGAMAGGVYRDLRPASRDLRLSRAESHRRPLRGRALYHLRLLVHSLDVLRQSCGDHRALDLRHLRGHRACWRAGLYRRTVHRNVCGGPS
jgi:hypothetical protein